MQIRVTRKSNYSSSLSKPRNVGFQIEILTLAESSIRFCVHDGKGRRSASWKCFSPRGKEDVYLTCRELRGTIKASLHESGACHLAYEVRGLERVPSALASAGKSRFIDTWQVKPSAASGAVLAVRIITPRASVATEDNDLGGLACAPIPSEGGAVEFYVIVTPEILKEGDWPGKRGSETSLIGSYALPSGRVVWVVWKEIPMPEIAPIAGHLRYFAGRSKTDLSSADLRLIAIAETPEGARVLLDGKIERF